MKLSRIERWILANQYRILAATDPANKDEHEYAAETLERGYELLYGHICPVYPDGDTLSYDECNEVIDILNMHRALLTSYDALAPHEKAQIDRRDIEFRGFDGNEESAYMNFAAHFCAPRNGNRFSELRPEGFDWNSHTPTLDRYRAMLREWRNSADKSHLTKDDIVRIVTAY